MTFRVNRFPPAIEAWQRSAIGVSALMILGSGACFFSVADVRKGSVDGEPGGAAGADAACADASVGVASCAQCAGDCLGGECRQGVCQPFPIAHSPPGAFALVLDVDDLYWTATDGVYRTAKIGGTEFFKKVAEATQPSALAIDSTWVYFADKAGARIAKVEKAGGFPQTVVRVDGPFALALDADVLYYGSAIGGVFRVNTDGSGVRELATLGATRAEAIWEIWVNATDVVLGDSDARGVFAVAKDGSSPARLLTKTTRDVFGVTGDASAIFFREGNPNVGLLSTVTAAGIRSDLLSTEPYPGSVAIDASFAYFVAGAGGSQIRRYDRFSTQVSTIAADQAQAYSVRADDTALYWTLAGTGDVIKLAK